MSESILKKTKNKLRAIGTVYEKDLKREDCEVNIKDKDGNPAGSVKAERVRGRVAVRTDSGVVTFEVFVTSINPKPDKNDKRDNPRWEMAVAMLDKWNPEINGNGEEPTRVSIEGNLDINDYVGQDGTVKSSLRRNVTKATTKIGANEPSGCSWSGDAYIKTIKHETRGEDEETGRLVVELLGANYKGECIPMKAFVEENLADDFEDAYEEEQTVHLDADIVVRHVGSKKAGKKAFGRSSSVSVNSGFDVTEMLIVGADDPIEEPDEDEDDNGWINPKAMKKAVKERAKKLEELASKDAPVKSEGKKFSAAKKPVAVAVDDDPFDDDDDMPF